MRALVYVPGIRSDNQPNVLTLSCKNRLTRLAKEAARRLPRLTEWQERTGSRRDARVQFEPPEAARRRARARGVLSACEGRWAALRYSQVPPCYNPSRRWPQGRTRRSTNAVHAFSH